MKWTKIEQEWDYFGLTYMCGDIYKGHLIRWRNGAKKGDNYQFHCWNIDTNSWRFFNIRDIGGIDYPVGELMVYKNLLLTVGGKHSQAIYLAMYNLESLGLESEKGPEEQHLFMNEEKSDVKLKVGDRIIPAHREILTKRSEYFASLFESGMAEKKQDVIEIKDCDFAIFQEFLRFLYCGEIKFDEELFAFRLLEFADKYVQEDLKARCLDSLKSKINSKNIFTIFEEAHARNLQDLKSWCYNHLKNVTLANFSKIIEFLIPKLNECPRDLRDIVLDWVLENYFEIYQEQNQSLGLCKEFLSKNIERETVVRIARFIAGESDIKNYMTYGIKKDFRQSYLYDKREDHEQWNEKIENEIITEAKEVFEQETVELRGKVFCFMQENWEEIDQEKAEEELPKKIFLNLISFMVKNSHGRDRKRKEPIQKGNEDAEKPELKKTKKCGNCGFEEEEKSPK